MSQARWVCTRTSTTSFSRPHSTPTGITTWDFFVFNVRNIAASPHPGRSDRWGRGKGEREDRKQQVLTLHCWQEKLQPGLSVSYSHCSLLDIYLHLKSLLGAYILSYIFKLSMKIKVMEFNIKGGFVKTVGRIYWGASQDRRSVGAGRLQDSVTDSARSLGALVLTLTVKCSLVMLLLMFQQQEKHLMIE